MGISRLRSGQVLPMNPVFTGWKPVPRLLTALNPNARESLEETCLLHVNFFGGGQPTSPCEGLRSPEAGETPPLFDPTGQRW